MHAEVGGWTDTGEIANQVGIATVNGNEYLNPDGVLLVGTKQLHAGTAQEVIDACIDEGGFCIICHPNLGSTPRFPVIPEEVRANLKGAVGFEVYNGCISRANLPGSGLATDFWDEMLSAGKRLWAFANDDFHDLHEMDVGWTMIYAASTTLHDLKAAVTRGSLYASNGLRLYDFRFDGRLLEVGANYPFSRSNTIDYTFIGVGGKIRKRTLAPRAGILWLATKATCESRPVDRMIDALVSALARHVPLWSVSCVRKG